MLEWGRALIKRIAKDFGAIDPLQDLCWEGKGSAAPDNGRPTPPGAPPPAPELSVDVVRTRVSDTGKQPLSAQAARPPRTGARRGRGRRTAGPSPGAGGRGPGRPWAGGAAAGPWTVGSGAPRSSGAASPWRGGLGEPRGLEGGRAPGMGQGIRRPGASQTQSLGQAGGRGGALPVPSTLHGLALVCAIPTGARAVCVPPLGPRGIPRGDPPTWGSARAHPCRVAPPTPGRGPRRGGRGPRVREATTGGRGLARGPRHPLWRQTPCCRHDRGRVAEQPRLAGEAADPSASVPVRAHRDDLWRRALTDATAQERRGGPVATPRGQAPAHAHGMGRPGEAMPRACEVPSPMTSGRDQGVCKSGGAQAHSCWSWGGIVGGSTSAHDGCRGRWQARDPPGREGDASGPGGLPGVQATRRGAPAPSRALGLRGAARPPGCPEGQGGDGGRPSRPHGLRRLARGAGRRGRAEDGPERTGASAQGARSRGARSARAGGRFPAAGGGHSPTTRPPLTISPHRMPSARRKAPLLGARIAPQQTAWGLYGMEVSHLPCSPRRTRGWCCFVKNSG